MDFPKKLKGILFDLDGTLIKSMEFHYEAWKAAMADFGVVITGDDYYPLEGMNTLEIAKKFCREHGLEESHSHTIVKKKEQYYLNSGLSNFYEGVDELITSFYSKGILLGIVTASDYQSMQKLMPASFLSKFKTIIDGKQTSRGKPFPDPYLKGLENLGITKEECVVIENAPLGVKSAKNAGIYCVGICSTVSKEKLREADLVIENISKLITLMI
ncbi:HAD family phosphatase [Candidatus Woesearchaeota archaeon]|nr:hypothetical protein [uncultured archaeon]MBS3124387.1 HAD family phosphatase [Candidatus Woesearchaeota archaeon]